jgi:TatD DNase family protein
MLETDCPYLAPLPYRGKRNEPAWVRSTAELIARERAISLEALAEATAANAARFYGL